MVAKKMFGEYALYLDDKLFALVCDDTLFVKPTEATQALTAGLDQAPPYPGAKPSFLVPADRCSDTAWLSELARATADALPAPKPKKPK